MSAGAVPAPALEPSEILKRAIRMEKQKGYFHPSVLKKRLLSIVAIWTIALGCGVVVAFEISENPYVAQQSKLVYGLCLLLSVAAWIASTMAGFLVLWNAYVHQYVLAITAKSETVDYLEDSVTEAALNLVSDPEFRIELVDKLSCVAATTPSVSPEQLADETISQVAKKAKAVAASMGR